MTSGSGGLGEAGAQGGAFALVDRVLKEPDARFRLGQRLEHLPSSVARGVIHHDDLPHQRLGGDGLEDAGNRRRPRCRPE